MAPFIKYLICAALALANTAEAAWTFMPESDFQRYRTYGLFFDQQTTAVAYGAARYWGAVGGSIAVAGDSEAEAHPQVLLTATANASMRVDGWGRFGTDSIDARAGAVYQRELAPGIRISAGVIHDSGHAADGMSAADRAQLEGANLGQESVPIRVIYDHERGFRAGVTLKPFIRSYPPMKTFAAEQFAEWFPWSFERGHANPYLALGLDQRGPRGTLANTVNAQAGVAWGNHFDPGFVQSARAVVGYYAGADPRLKYFEYRAARLAYAYLGLMLDI